MKKLPSAPASISPYRTRGCLGHLLLAFGLVCACDDTGPELVRSRNAEDAALNCELLSVASDWYCVAEDRRIPLSCSWGAISPSGEITIKGSTGCVTTTCEVVLSQADEDCFHNQNGEAVLRADNTAECCTEESCGTEFGCF